MTDDKTPKTSLPDATITHVTLEQQKVDARVLSPTGLSKVAVTDIASMAAMLMFSERKNDA